MAFVVDTGGTTLAPSAKPGSPAQRNSRYRYERGEPMSRSTYQPPRPPVRTGTALLTPEEANALYGPGGTMAVTEDRPAVYYGPGGTLVYPANYRNPNYAALDQATTQQERDAVRRAALGGSMAGNQAGILRDDGGELQYAEGFETSLPITLGWSDSEVDEFRRLAAFIRPFYPSIFDEPLGQQGVNDWGRTEGDLQAARWLGGLANSQDTDIMTAARTLAREIEGGNIVPFDVLSDLQGLDSGATDSASEFDLLTKRIDTQISLSSFDRARQLLAAEMRDLLGRDPSKQEISQFLSTLNSLERANPTIVTNEFTYDEERYGAQQTSQTVTTEPGEVDSTGAAFSAAFEGNEEEATDFGLGRVRRLLNEMVGL